MNFGGHFQMNFGGHFPSARRQSRWVRDHREWGTLPGRR